MVCAGGPDRIYQLGKLTLREGLRSAAPPNQHSTSFRTPDQGLSKVGRQAVQTFGDGTTAAWGEANYQGVLYPRSISPAAAWDWSAVQWSGDPSSAETWDTHVADVGRETVGAVELIHLHVTTVTDTDTFESDEYLASR